MKKKLTIKEYIFVASMLFGMFFGAGNLIFPVSMGQQAGNHTIIAAIGFCVTGVGLPLLGIAAMGISESKGLFHMSCKVGKGFAYFFTCALYLTIGPLFAIPRTATVSYQIGIAPFITEQYQTIALAAFSLIFFAVVLFFSMRPSNILTWIGKVLNPLFLLFLGILIVISFLQPMGAISLVNATGQYVSHAFMTGFMEGYNTMDALASLAFGIILIEVIQGLGVTDSGRISLCTIQSGVLSTILMAFIYCSLAIMGAGSAATLGVSEDGGTALYAIASHYFGSVGGVFLGIMITFACMKTSIALVTACSTIFSELFPKLLSYQRCAVLFSLFSFAISNAGLNTIIGLSLPVLSFLYPITIVLIVLCLFGRLFQYEKSVFAGGILCTMAAAPFTGGGLGWVIPAMIGSLVGMLFTEKCKRSKAVRMLSMIIVTSLIGIIVSRVLYQYFHHTIFLTCYITCLTISYHFIMRICVGESVTIAYRKREFHYEASWYRLHQWEEKLYAVLHLKRWKTKLITARPEQFDVGNRSYEELLHNMTQAELVHEIIMVLSFVPLLFIIPYGEPVVFIVTSVIACMIDCLFVMIQRYNRPRIQHLFLMHNRIPCKENAEYEENGTKPL